ncbi:hypothetical protein NGUA11_00019 [Salmonella enterica]|uniref:Uncharacterized protein n=1 Tax=Salmonella paratyphi B (strain ATCC BAA-1250 / SPB7) TaxID=1016998 RepID=A0A6C6Z3P2_SALPB|nr:hypothetical protein SPAB_03047 [Salmonella enterica subsp. enterica serovar Paratyphi B str. SPB7]GAR40712.1 hypothetical protein NGUA11_00019 [Salmonella enterica]
MTRQYMANASMLTHCRIEGVDCSPRNAECCGDTFFFQHIHCRIHGSHFCHFIATSFYWKKFPTFKNFKKVPLQRAGCGSGYRGF